MSECSPTAADRVSCPLCDQGFPATKIELHAMYCNGIVGEEAGEDSPGLPSAASVCLLFVLVPLSCYLQSGAAVLSLSGYLVRGMACREVCSLCLVPSLSWLGECYQRLLCFQHVLHRDISLIDFVIHHIISPLESV